jgi:hypothetical protein
MIALTLIEQVAPGAVWPGIASAVVFFVAVLLGRLTRRVWLRDAVAALAVAAGFAAGFVVVLERWPSLPLAPGTDAFYWVAWFAVGGWIAGLAELPGRVPGTVSIARALLRVGVSLGAAWLLVQPLVPHALSTSRAWLVAAASALVMAGLWTVAAREARAEETPGRVALPFVVAVGAAAAVLALLAGSLSMGQVTGALSASLGSAFALAFLLKVPATSRATAPVVALVFGGLLLAAYAYLNYGDSIYFPWLSALLLAAGPVAGIYLPRGLAGKLPGIGKHPLVETVLLGAIPPLVAAALAAWIAYANAPPPNPYA